MKKMHFVIIALAFTGAIIGLSFILPQPMGAFWDEAVRKVMNMPDEEHPLCIMPVGRK